MSPKPLTSAQIRAARALIRWSALQLAKETSVGVTTIRRAELTASETKLTRVNDQAIRRVLETAGVEFIDTNGGGPGVPAAGRPTERKLGERAHARVAIVTLSGAGGYPLRWRVDTTSSQRFQRCCHWGDGYGAERANTDLGWSDRRAHQGPMQKAASVPTA